MAQSKAKYWWAVLYPESMVDNWQDKISNLVQVPFAYCIHNMDILSDSIEPERKTHVHLILAFPNTTTYNNALSVFNLLQPNCTICKRIISIRHAYNYIIHDTDDCREKKKYLYPEKYRVTGNNFDIGCYEQVSTEDKHKMIFEMCNFIKEFGFTNMIDFSDALIISDKFDNKESFEMIIGYHSLFETYCRGNYLKEKK